MGFTIEKENQEKLARLPLEEIWGGVDSVEKYGTGGLLSQFF